MTDNPTIPNEKACSICGVTKPLDVFENDRRRPDGHGPRCKDCIKNKRKADRSPEALAQKAQKKAKQVSVEGWTEGEPKEKKSRLRGTKPGFDKFGEDLRESAKCTCGEPGSPHYRYRHVEVPNPNGPGTILVCWASKSDNSRCQCRNFTSKTGGK